MRSDLTSREILNYLSRLCLFPAPSAANERRRHTRFNDPAVTARPLASWVVATFSPKSARAMLTRRRLLSAGSAAATAYVAYASCEEKGPDRFGLTHPYRPEPEAEGTPHPTESPSPRSSTWRPRVLVTGFHDWRELESNIWRCVRSACARCARRVSRRGTRRGRPRAPCPTPHAHPGAATIPAAACSTARRARALPSRKLAHSCARSVRRHAANPTRLAYLLYIGLQPRPPRVVASTT
jgi:hypothetical protein